MFEFPCVRRSLLAGVLLAGVLLGAFGWSTAAAQSPPPSGPPRFGDPQSPDAPTDPTAPDPDAPVDPNAPADPNAPEAMDREGAPARAGRGDGSERRGRGRGRADDEALQFRVETIPTRDGVPLAVGYFPSDQGVQAVPVIIVHEWKGSAPPYVPLAEALRNAGCAVFTIDLRGHGASRTYVDARGQTREFDVSRMTRAHVQAMLSSDLEALKGFIAEENDAERLNLNALTLVGFGEGAILAAHYAVMDWNFPDVGGRKQSKDVRALVAVSPQRVVQGVTVDPALRHPIVSRLPWLILAGDSSPEAAEAERWHRQLERLRRAGTAGTLTLELLSSGASNVRLIRDERDAIPQIVQFIETNVIEAQEQFPWVSRAE